MGDFWAGALLGAALGIPIGVFVNKVTEWSTRSRSYKATDQLVGTWTAHELLDGRRVNRAKKMDGSGDTIISHKSGRWSAESHVLWVNGEDMSDGRHHSGPLVIDPVCSRLATRIVISHDFKTLYVFPVEAVATFGARTYSRGHALCKVEKTDSTA
jgi:hypothetical protein